MNLPRDEAAPSVAGFVLAGGKSSRMGQEKAHLLLGNSTLLSRAEQTLRDAGIEVAIAGARSALDPPSPLLPEQNPQGPLTGICSALASTSAEFAVFVPVDLPMLPSSLIQYMMFYAQATESLCLVLSVSGFIQTFPAVIQRAALPSLQRALASPDRGCLKAFRAAAQDLGQPLTVLPVELLAQSGHVSHPAGLPPALWFLNVNTPADFARAQRLLADSVRVS